MGKLLDAILYHDTSEIRNLVRTNPSLASTRNPAGNLPLDVAKSTGNVISYVALLRENCPSDSDLPVDCGLLLEDYIRTLSDDFFCSGWQDGIEFTVYAIMIGDRSPIYHNTNLSELDNDAIDDLKFLLDESNQWPHWNESIRGVELIGIEKWEAKYKRR